MVQYRKHLAAALLGALALSACGTTVPTSQRPASGDQLGALPNSSVPSGTDGGTPGSVAGTTGGVGGGTPSGGSTGSVAGTGTTGTASGTTSSTTGSTGSVPPANGTSVKTPIKVGIVLTATSNASSFGVKVGNTYDEKQVDDAIVAGLNAAGGLAGRRIVPVYAKTDTGSNNWETDFSAACATFTQDNHVEVVLGYVFNYFASFERCLANKGIPHLNTGFNIPDRKELAAFPRQVALDVPTIDRRGLVKLEGAVADGVLTSKSKIGVLSDTCPGTQRSLQDVFLPKAKSLGITVAKSIQINCANGNSDSGAAVTALQNAVLQFASAGVDQVVFHAVSEGPALLLFSTSAESQGYRPHYLVTSLANLDALKGFLPPAQARNVNGYGWLATQDVPPTAYGKPNAQQQRCLGLLKSKSITPTTSTDFYYAYNFCEAVFVYERALTQTRGSSDGAAVVQAVKAIGTSFPSLVNNGGSLFSPSLPDAPRAARHVVFLGSCSCYVYTGPTRPIPTS